MSVKGLHILEQFVAEAGRGKSYFDANFGANMQHERKITKAEEQDVAFASDVCAALGARRSVKANSSKEILIDRISEQHTRKNIVPGLKKMHNRIY